MKTPQYLFKLIKSLSEKEKLAILSEWKANCTSSGSIYMSLFNELSKLDDYDEKKFIIDNAGQPFLKNFSYNKHYLCKKLLTIISKNLCDDDNTESYLIEKIRTIRFLIAKGLYKHAMLIILKAEKISWNEEYFQEYIIILNLKKIVTLSLYKGKKLFQLTDNIYKNIENAQKVLNEIILASKLNNNLFILYNSNGYFSDSFYKKELASIFRNKFYENENKLSVDASVYYYGDKFIQAIDGNDTEICYMYARKRYELVKKNNFYSKKYPISLFASLSDLLHVLLHQKRFKLFEKYFKEFISLKHIDYSSKEMWFFEKYFLEVQYNIIQDKHNSVAMIYERFLKERKEYSSVNFYSNPIIFDLLFLFSYSFLKNKNYTESIRLINQISGDEFKGLNHPLYYSFSIMKIIIYYKLGFTQNTVSEIKSLKRYLILKKKLTDFDVKFLGLFI